MIDLDFNDDQSIFLKYIKNDSYLCVIVENKN